MLLNPSSKSILALLICAILPYASATEKTIESNKAVFHIGESLIVCGEVKETKAFNKGLYINLGETYPKQHITILIWESDLASIKSKFGAPESLISKKICTYGEISEYNKKLQIKLENINFFRVMK